MMKATGRALTSTGRGSATGSWSGTGSGLRIGSETDLKLGFIKKSWHSARNHSRQFHYGIAVTFSFPNETQKIQSKDVQIRKVQSAIADGLILAQQRQEVQGKNRVNLVRNGFRIVNFQFSFWKLHKYFQIAIQ